jgi:hypothetical protein
MDVRWTKDAEHSMCFATEGSRIKQEIVSLAKLLRKMNVTAFPLYGTLLGMIRDDDIIPYDVDVDFGIMLEEYHKMMPIEQETGHGEGQPSIKHLNSLVSDGGEEYLLTRQQNGLTTIERHIKNDTYLPFDFYIYEEKNNLLMSSIPSCILSVEEAFPLQLKSFFNADKVFSCIARPEQCLSRCYGKDWEVPKTLGSYTFTSLSYLDREKGHSPLLANFKAKAHNMVEARKPFRMAPTEAHLARERMFDSLIP